MPKPSGVRHIDLSEYEEELGPTRILFGKLIQNSASLFIILNFYAGFIVILCLIVDIFLLKFNLIAPENRIVNSSIIASIIGATVVQSGAAFYLIIKKGISILD